MGEWMDCGDAHSGFAAFSGADGSPVVSSTQVSTMLPVFVILCLITYLSSKSPSAQRTHTHKYIDKCVNIT